jgi:hypothetical protein
MTDTNSDTKTSTRERRGVPLWMPIVGLTIAFLLALFVASQVFPILSALVFPPELATPPGNVRIIEKVNKGQGLDETLYAIDAPACGVVRYYQDLIGGCNYDISAPCTGSAEISGVPQSALPIAQCVARQSFGSAGDFGVLWRIFISTGTTQEEQTYFRVIREIGN